jgi:hypothetical protein
MIEISGIVLKGPVRTKDFSEDLVLEDFFSGHLPLSY